MKKILKKDWEYTLYESSSKIILSVLCGGVALFYVNIELDSSEKDKFIEFGESFISDFADKIREKPTMFKKRHKELSNFV